MFYDVIPCQTMSELCISVDLTCHKLHIGLPVIHHGLYVMCERLPVMQRVCLSHATTAIMTHA